jgi:CBS domain-containing protein
MTIEERIRSLRVRDLMTSEVRTAAPGTPTGKVLETMQSEQISAMPIVEQGRCVGIVTATDLVRLIRDTNEALRSGYPHYEDCLWAVDLAHRLLDQQPIRELMNVSPDTVAPDTPICEAADRMASEQIHHLVVESDGEMVGFLSAWDLARAIC